VSPQVAVISVGVDNAYGHPNAETLTRLGTSPAKDSIFRTDVNGTVELITDGRRLWVRTEK